MTNRPAYHPGRPIAVHFNPTEFDAITITTTEWCPTCDGEKTETVEVQGGTWNSYYGTWEPDEREVPCERCDGAGTMERTRCAACGLLHDSDEWGTTTKDVVCNCDTADLAAFYYRVTEAERRGEPHGCLGWNELHYLAARDGAAVAYDRTGSIRWATAPVRGFGVVPFAGRASEFMEGVRGGAFA